MESIHGNAIQLKPEDRLFAWNLSKLIVPTNRCKNVELIHEKIYYVRNVVVAWRIAILCIIFCLIDGLCSVS